MMSLSTVSVLVGLAGLGFAVAAGAYPGMFRGWLGAFPRSKVAGWILTAVDLAWVGWLLKTNSLGGYEYLKPLTYGALPVLFFLSVFLMDDLLAARALGGLLMLLPGPLLEAARFHESSWRLILVGVAYVMAIEGMALMLSPYLMRKTTESLLGTDGRCRAWGAIAGVLSIVLVGLGAVTFRA